MRASPALVFVPLLLAGTGEFPAEVRTEIISVWSATLVLSLPLPAIADLALSSGDQRLLREGHILFKADIPAGGTGDAALGGTAVALLHTDTETVWRTLVDFPGHAGLFPRVKESQALERHGKHTLVQCGLIRVRTTTSSGTSGATGRSSHGARERS